MSQPTRRRGHWDAFYFIFQTLPAVLATVGLLVVSAVYGLFRLVT